MLGKPVVLSKGDSGDTPDSANQTVDRLLGENVDAIIGAASSGVSLTVIDKITGAGIVQFSPANTSDKLSTYADKGLYFRVAPPDLLQGAVIAKLVADDGATNVAIIARNDAYGTGLAEVVEKTLEAAGITVAIVRSTSPKQARSTPRWARSWAPSPDASRRDRLRGVVEDPAHHGRERRRSEGHRRLRLRRQHRQRPRRELRRRQVILTDHGSTSLLTQ